MDTARSGRGRVKGPPRALRDAVSGALGQPALWVEHDGEIPSAPGAYLLLACLPAELHVPQKRFAGQCLPAGWYGYAGSANGPGGLRARVGRHLKRDKPLRWHIDWLTVRAPSLQALCFPRGRECDLVQALLAAERFKVSIAGFGSSDCRVCPTHLLRWQAA